MKELDIEARTENLDEVMDFINEQLEVVDCPMKIQMQIDLAVEEIFVNIANYAYQPETGPATVRVEVQPDGSSVSITFIDVTLSAEERSIGGLGIFLVKKNMDDVRYEYINGSNILTIEKGLAR